jgi:DNA-binding SARP family transcriptional activator
VAVKVNLLGPLEVEDDGGRPVAISGAKQRALLSLLASNAGRAVSADRLAETLWGDAVARVANADNALQHHVSRLRKLLGPERLAGQASGYVLRLQPDDVDAGRFERLVSEGREELGAGRAEAAATLFREAARLWRGPPLEELETDWARFDAVRLQQLRLESARGPFRRRPFARPPPGPGQRGRGGPARRALPGAAVGPARDRAVPLRPPD